VIRILNIAGRFWAYAAPPVQVPIWKGRMYRIFDTVEEAAEFRRECLR
jgi:hypothetical protein